MASNACTCDDDDIDFDGNLVSPAFTKTNLNGYEGSDGPTGTFTRWDNVDIPW